jgi:thioesterase domain-containing protein
MKATTSPEADYDFHGYRSKAANAKMTEKVFDIHRVDAQSHIVDLLRSGSGPTLVCFPGSGGNVHIFDEMAKALTEPCRVAAVDMEWLCELNSDFNVEQLAALYLDAVRSLDDAKPYCLCGYSFGGLVAYEIGRRLREQGERVAFVALLDCPNPALISNLSPSESAEFRRAYVVDRIRRYMGHLLRADFRSFVNRAAALVVSRSSKGLVPIVKAVCQFAKIPIPVVVRSNDPGFSRAWNSYKPMPTSNHLVCFRTHDRGQEHDRDPSMGWGGTVSGIIDVRVVAAGHVDMMSSSSVHLVAGIVTDYLRTATLSTPMGAAER